MIILPERVHRSIMRIGLSGGARISLILVKCVLVGHFTFALPVSDQSQIDSLIGQVRKYKETNPTLARSTLHALKDTRLSGYQILPEELLLLEGEILIQENKAKDGLEKIEEARKLFATSENSAGLAAVYDALTQHYSESAEYPKALEYAFQSIAIKEDLGDQAGLSRSFVDVADIYWYYQRIDESINYGEKAVALIEDQGPSIELAEAYKMLSESYLELPDYDLALTYINQSIAVKESLGLGTLDLLSAINSRGNVYKYLERYEDALEDYGYVLKICDSINYSICIRVAAANLGHIYLLKNEFEKAIPYKLRSLEIQQNSGQSQQMVENLRHVSEAYTGLGDFKNALAYRLKLDSIKSIEHEQALDKLTNELSVQYETEKKEDAIQHLNKQVYWQRLSIILGGIILSISLFAIWAFLRLNRELKIRNNENELLLKEIHHRVKNNLQILSSLLSLQSDHLLDAGAIDAINEGRNRVESMGMIHQQLYRDSDVSSVDMQEYIPELCRYLEDSFSMSNKSISIKEEIRFHEMDVDFAIPMGLIINELVTNSVKYAFADKDQGELAIYLGRQKEALVLRVSDNGHGQKLASSTTISTSFGSMLVDTLSKKLKGVVEVDLSHGYSTTIRFFRFEKIPV